MAILFTLRVFVSRNIFIFSFLGLTCYFHSGLMSNNPTHYLLAYGDSDDVITKLKLSTNGHYYNLQLNSVPITGSLLSYNKMISRNSNAGSKLSKAKLVPPQRLGRDDGSKPANFSLKVSQHCVRLLYFSLSPINLGFRVIIMRPIRE